MLKKSLITTLNHSIPEIQAEISEIFSSIQGEGPFLGVQQIFMRFGRCNMHCVYCDEVGKMDESHYRRVSLGEVLCAVDRFVSETSTYHSVSLTGGEPLFYVNFLEQILPLLKSRGLKRYLETNGTLPKALERVINEVDIIAMDIKPPSSSKDRSYWKEHEHFLEIARRKDLFVKVVVSEDVSVREVELACQLVKNISAQIPFILQPVTDVVGINCAALKRVQNELYPLASKILRDVRVIPQMHKVWGFK